jgi:hypothetical protein
MISLALRDNFVLIERGILKVGVEGMVLLGRRGSYDFVGLFSLAILKVRGTLISPRLNSLLDQV